MSEDYDWNQHYYCNGCHKFHHYGSHSVVSAKLCMVCHQKKTKRTKVLTEKERGGKLQICADCLDKIENLDDYK